MAEFNRKKVLAALEKMNKTKGLLEEKVDLKKAEKLSDEKLEKLFYKACEGVTEEDSIPDSVADLYNQMVDEEEETEEPEESEESEETDNKKEKGNMAKNKNDKKVDKKKKGNGKAAPADKKGKEKSAPAKKSKSEVPEDAISKKFGVKPGSKAYLFCKEVVNKPGITMAQIQKCKWNDSGATYNGTLSKMKTAKLMKSEDGKIYPIGKK